MLAISRKLTISLGGQVESIFSLIVVAALAGMCKQRWQLRRKCLNL